MLRMKTVLAALAGAALFGIPALSAAPNPIDDIRADAVQLRLSADNLMMMARAPMKHSREAYVSELARARKFADRLGEKITGAPAVDDRIRGAVRDADLAIQFFNARPWPADMYAPEYQARVESLYNGAKALTKPSVAAADTATD